MKKKYWLVAGFSLGLMFACGGNSKKETMNNQKDSVSVVNAEKPYAESEQKASLSFTMGPHTYRVSIYRYPDQKLPLVVDDMDQKYYDNSVEVSIQRDEETLASRIITKEVFKSMLPENDYRAGMLLGMNCDTARCETSRLCFTAQVGQAGEGPAFLVYIPTDGGEMCVSRDMQQEDISYRQ